MHVYPGIFAIAGLSETFIVLFGLLSTWSQTVRDKEFLVEMRLRNLEQEKGAERKVNAIVKDAEADGSEISVE